MVAAVKNILHEYIEQADEQKLQAIYTLVENEIENRSGIYNEATLASFKATSEDYLSGKMKGATMEESLQRIRLQIAGK